jgi:hypothetical protein
VELDAAHSRLAEVERHERTVASKNEGLKRDLGVACTARDVVVKEKTWCAKLNKRSCNALRIMFIRSSPSFGAIWRPLYLVLVGEASNSPLVPLCLVSSNGF